MPLPDRTNDATVACNDSRWSRSTASIVGATAGHAIDGACVRRGACAMRGRSEEARLPPMLRLPAPLTASLAAAVRADKQKKARLV